VGAPGLGHDKVMHPPDASRVQELRAALEHEWIPGMQRLLALDDAALPADSVAPAIAETTLARLGAA
jgi:hypothetical protein